MKIRELNQLLLFNGQVLRDSQNLGYYGVKNNSVLFLILKVLNQGNQLYAKIPGGKLVSLDLPLSEQVVSAKNQIQVKESIPTSSQTLFFTTKELEDRKTFSDYSLQKGDVLEVNFAKGDKIVLTESEVLDPTFDFDFTDLSDDGKVFRRGGKVYERPCGWKRIAFQVRNKYENEAWLGSANMSGEWPVAYHGCHVDYSRVIGYDGFELTKLKRFPNGKIHFVTPKLELAVGLANEITVNGQSMKILMKSRVNPEKIIERKD